MCEKEKESITQKYCHLCLVLFTFQLLSCLQELLSTMGSSEEEESAGPHVQCYLQLLQKVSYGTVCGVDVVRSLCGW